jgi:catechol 2,3-dioxygenase-like lactoylglutathione lyase family enzyme
MRLQDRRRRDAFERGAAFPCWHSQEANASLDEDEMMTITHVMLGTNDVAKARAFYDAVLSPLGFPKAQVDPHRAQYAAPGMPPLMIGPPYNGEQATYGNGTMVGFAAASPSAVDAFHAAALAHGGSCEGPPGPRDYAPGLYGAYVRDPDGNKLSVYHFGA